MPPSRIYVHPTAVIIGDVTLGDGVSVWPNAVIRGDANRIEVGENSNVQDLAVLHTSHDHPTIIGRETTIGHGAMINGAKLGDFCLIGMNSTILDGAVIGDECIIGANALVTSRTVIPARSVAMGVPAKVVRENDVTVKEVAARSSRDYQTLRDDYLNGRHKRHTF